MKRHEQPEGARESPDRTPERKPADAGDGVDVTLIRWMLSLTPRERLGVLEEHVRAALALRRHLS